MIEFYLAPRNLDEYEKIIPSIKSYFKIGYKSEYSDLPIVKQILKEIDNIVFVKGKYVENEEGQGYSIYDISNTARMAIIMNVFPDEGYFFRFDLMGGLAYKFIMTAPEDKTIRFLLTTSYEEECYPFPKNKFFLVERKKFIEDEIDFDYELGRAFQEGYLCFWNLDKKAFDEKGNLYPPDKLKEMFKEELASVGADLSYIAGGELLE